MVNLKQVEEIVKILSKYEGFVSEAHLQHSFALEMSRQYPYLRIFPEFKIDVIVNGKRYDFELDLLILDQNDGSKTCVELKYKTCNAESDKLNHYLIDFKSLKETYHPKNHGAEDLSFFDCWIDIERLDLLLNLKRISNGFFVFITNDIEFYKYKTFTGKDINRAAWTDFRMDKSCDAGIKRIGHNKNGNKPSVGDKYLKHDLYGNGDGSIYISKDYGPFLYKNFGIIPTQRSNGILPPMDEFKSLVLEIK